MSNDASNELERPSDEEILAYAAGELDPESARAMGRLIERFPEIARDAAKIGAILETMRADESVEPPPALVERALRRARADIADTAASPARDPGAPGLLDAVADHVRRVIATLVLDSRRDAALGFRGAAEGCHLMYDSPIGRVDLELQSAASPGASLRAVQGQVAWRSGASDAWIIVTARGEARPVARHRSDVDGCFAFEVPAGVYEVAVVRDDDAIVVPEITVE